MSESLRTRWRWWLDGLAGATGLMARCEALQRRSLTILMYHRVLPDAEAEEYPFPALAMPVGAFRRQMQWLAERCSVVPVSEGLELLSAQSDHRKPLVAVTFDDGYRDNFTRAAPAMEDHSIRGTFFISTGFVREGGPLWFDRAAGAWAGSSLASRRALLREAGIEDGVSLSKRKRWAGFGRWLTALKSGQPGTREDQIKRAVSAAGGGKEWGDCSGMTPEQIGALAKKGHEIGSHTVSHGILPQLDDEALAGELRQSRRELERWTGREIGGFCYPNGDYDDRVEKAVRDAGYRYACTVEEGSNRMDARRTRLRRVPMTVQRVFRLGRYDALGFRAEVSRARSLWRKRWLPEGAGCSLSGPAKRAR